jgi:hypothetical protein
MSNTAPYTIDIAGSDDETFSFTIPFEMADGTAFPFSDYAIEYSIPGKLSLTEGNGITVTPPDVEFKAARGTLCQATYTHGCRVRYLATGEEFQVFDGTVTIGDGGF